MQSPPSLLLNLPDEILEKIANRLESELPIGPSYSYNARALAVQFSQRPWAVCRLVCKRLYAFTTPLLYDSLVLAGSQESIRFENLFYRSELLALQAKFGARLRTLTLTYGDDYTVLSGGAAWIDACQNIQHLDIRAAIGWRQLTPALARLPKLSSLTLRDFRSEVLDTSFYAAYASLLSNCKRLERLEMFWRQLQDDANTTMPAARVNSSLTTYRTNTAHPALQPFHRLLASFAPRLRDFEIELSSGDTTITVGRLARLFAPNLRRLSLISTRRMRTIEIGWIVALRHLNVLKLEQVFALDLRVLFSALPELQYFSITIRDQSVQEIRDLLFTVSLGVYHMPPEFWLQVIVLQLATPTTTSDITQEQAKEWDRCLLALQLMCARGNIILEVDITFCKSKTCAFIEIRSHT